jgi:hypothetical protein
MLDSGNSFLYSCCLPLPQQLSPSFGRFAQEFNSNIDYILKYTYRLIASQTAVSSTTLSNAEKVRLQTKYENLLGQSKEMCKRFTGPHSVLQIFLEKIIGCIWRVSSQIKDMTKDHLGLWQEQRSTTYPLKGRSSSADTELLITTTQNNSITN